MKPTFRMVVLGLLTFGPLTAVAQNQTVDWTLPAIDMVDGSQVSGSFTWDVASNTVTDWSFTLTDGTDPNFPAATLDPSTSTASTSNNFLRFVHNTIIMGTTPPRGLELRLGLVSPDDLDTPVANLPLSSNVDPNPTNLGSFFCYNCAPVLWPTVRGFLTAAPEEPEVFSIIVLPDTQMYSEAHPEILEAQMDWIVANEDNENIIYVAHLGDLKDDSSCDNKVINAGTGAGRTEWQILNDAFTKLDNANIPYGVVPGNHDFDQVSNDCPNFTTQRPLTTYNTLFGPSRFAGDPWYGDTSVPTPGNRVANSNEDNFTLFEGVCGVKFIAINLAYKQGANAQGQDQELQWADALLKTYSDRLGILTTHYFLEENPGNAFGPYGQETYDELSDNANFFMMLSAHERGEAWRVDATNRGGMQPVHALLADYQSTEFPASDGDPNTPPTDPNPANLDFSDLDTTQFGDSGFMRIMRFDPETEMVNIETFMPPVVPIKGRPSTIVSTYFPADGTGMDRFTASNFSLSFQGYGSDSNCSN